LADEDRIQMESCTEEIIKIHITIYCIYIYIW